VKRTFEAERQKKCERSGGRFNRGRDRKRRRDNRGGSLLAEASQNLKIRTAKETSGGRRKKTLKISRASVD